MRESTRFLDARLMSVWDKIQNGRRLTQEDGETLFLSRDLTGLGKMASWMAERKNGNRGLFVLNRQINPTNICLLSCKFCEFASKPGRADAYALSMDEILAKCSPEIREVHIVGGLNRDWPVSHYIDIIAQIHKAFPALQIKAYTAVEIDWFARRADVSLENILTRLKEAGLSCLPGGGAEVFSERVRKALFPFKIGAPKWFEVHRTAHRLGIRSNATLLYGHIEDHAERVSHMIQLRQLQDETQGFMSFIPLAFQPGGTGIEQKFAGSVEDLKTIAISRLILDNFDHIKAYWVTVGEETASMALQFGADDIDGTIFEEKIMHAAKAKTPVAMARDHLVELIHSSGKVPTERDALYNLIRTYDEEQSVAYSRN